MPTEKQILGAKIRTVGEKFIDDNKKPCRGGFLVPSNKDKNAFVANMFGMPVTEVSYFFTYARSCTHSWAEGACDRCPE